MKIAIIVTARPSWAKLAPLCAALKRRPNVELQIIACASALLTRYGAVVDIIRQQYPIAAECWTVHEGTNLITSAKETGALVTELAGVLSRLQPDLAVVCADRHEVLAAAQAVSYLHIPLVHLQGGEKTGSIDDKVRDSITALADWHMVATRRAQMRVYALTGDMDRVIWSGCPSIDVAKQALTEPPVTFEDVGGVYEDDGYLLKDFSQPFQMVLFHPVTDEADQAQQQMQQVLSCVTRVHLPRLVFWPGQDAGSDAMSKMLREWVKTYNAKASGGDKSWHLIRNLPPNRFLRLVSQAAVLVGNSSAGIREASYLGTPVVNIGTRQQGRERGPNVVDVGFQHRVIIDAIQSQAAHGKYPSSTLYGQGNAGERIAEVLIERCVGNHSSTVG